MKLPAPAPSSGGGSSIGADNFLNLKAGDEVKVVFRGEPYVIYQRWPNGGQKEVFQTPEPGTRPRYLMNAVIHDGKKFIVKVWEMAAPTYKDLYKINEHYPLEETKVLISREGSGKNTKYHLLPLFNDKLSPKVLKELEELELHTLNASADQEKPDVPNVPGGEDDSDSIPF